MLSAPISLKFFIQVHLKGIPLGAQSGIWYLRAVGPCPFELVSEVLALVSESCGT